MPDPVRHNWFHITAHFYGQWLQGDPRGWRERDHRRHVDGDYRHPPVPSAPQRKLLLHARKSLKCPPVVLSEAQRAELGNMWLRETQFYQVPCIALAISCTHVHGLMDFPDRAPKNHLGKIKRHIHHLMQREGTWSGPLWAAGSHAKPIRDRAHQVRTFDYILNHKREGAWVWSFRDTRVDAPTSEQ